MLPGQPIEMQVPVAVQMGGVPPFAWRPHAAVFDIGCCRLGVECLMLDAGCCKLGRRGCFKILGAPIILALPTYF